MPLLKEFLLDFCFKIIEKVQGYKISTSNRFIRFHGKTFMITAIKFSSGITSNLVINAEQLCEIDNTNGGKCSGKRI